MTTTRARDCRRGCKFANAVNRAIDPAALEKAQSAVNNERTRQCLLFFFFNGIGRRER